MNTHTEPQIKSINTKSLVGLSKEMSIINDSSIDLFSNFAKHRKHIDAVNSNVYEVMVYNKNYFKKFNPSNMFVKWVTVEVLDPESVPNGMRVLTLKKGLYAVFNYIGMMKDFGSFMNYIFMEWLAQSNYLLDNRPHFQILGEKYKHNQPDSEEEVWIPIKTK
jgi:AraC family transcriptional regulator